MAKQKTEKPSLKRRHRIAKEYLLAVADRLHSINPTEEIVFNTVKDVWCDGYAKGYMAHISDAKYFRDKRDADIRQSFDSIKDSIDDEIHAKPQS